jgi:hypothetical protein
MKMSKTNEIKQIGNIEYYIGKFETKNGDVQYGIHARDAATKKALYKIQDHLGFFLS